MLESRAFLYSQANGALQAQDAAEATEMHSTQGTSVRVLEQFKWDRFELLCVISCARMRRSWIHALRA